MNAQMLELVLLAIVAGVMLFRLKNVLGTRTGHEKPKAPPVSLEGEKDSTNNVVSMQGQQVVTPDKEPSHEDIKAIATLESPIGKGLLKIKSYEPHFDIPGFMEGAKGAYEMLLMAFENGEKQVLEGFLSPEVYNAFCTAIDQRDADGLSVDARFIGIRTISMTEVNVDDETAEADITLKFSAEVVTAVRNAAGDVVEGDPTAVRRISDIWTFSRSLGSENPNWTLVATGE